MCNKKALCANPNSNDRLSAGNFTLTSVAWQWLYGSAPNENRKQENANFRGKTVLDLNAPHVRKPRDIGRIAANHLSWA